MRLPPLRFRPTCTAPIVSANALIHRYARLGQIDAARKVFDGMPERSVVSFNSLIAGCFLNRHASEAQKLFDRMPQRNTASYNAMISGYVKNGRLADARAVFESMPQRNVVSWTSMVRGLVQAGAITEAESLFRLMPERNIVSWTVMLGDLIQDGRVDDACRLFDEMPEKDIVARTSMISGYCQFGRTAEAREMFDEMPRRNVISWTAMISGYAQNLQVDLARKLFEMMPERNEVSWTAILTGYIQAGRIEEAAELFRRMPEHSLVACNAMILGFGQHGMVAEAREVFDRMAERDDGSWSAMVKVYERNGFQLAAIDVFRKMQMNGICANFPSIIGILTVCTSLAILDHGREVHAVVLRSYYDADVFVVSALMTMYAKCGHEALSVFNDMKSTGMVPDEITFIGVLSSCSYSGKVKEGREVFVSMRSNSSVEAKAEHYACACRTHMDMEIAEIAAKKLLLLEPGNAGPYILLSNMCASSGRWKDVVEPRKVMSIMNVSKSPGSSRIEYGKNVHMFTCGDVMAHPEHRLIVGMLERLDGLLREAGYSPDADVRDENFILTIEPENLIVEAVVGSVNSATRATTKVALSDPPVEIPVMGHLAREAFTKSPPIRTMEVAKITKPLEPANTIEVGDLSEITSGASALELAEAREEIDGLRYHLEQEKAAHAELTKEVDCSKKALQEA
ncbi:Pentatricopeptide repeat-containing protein, mitochondrial [Cocos nucifera]|uniref:Pentatricopeptide repeat-containing protein, mitochondrial n=1 Tax=Cocos nucifera TaxID=13894 RepID=A0A8K0I6P9_COCNU|nr:Pentatricopeptide repeat-containing protein, mitochondrial [Cocos nucifera]